MRPLFPSFSSRFFTKFVLYRKNTASVGAGRAAALAAVADFEEDLEDFD